MSNQNPSQTTEHLEMEIKRENFLWRLGLLLQRQTYDAGCAWPFLQRYHSNTASEDGLRKPDYLVKRFYQVTNDIVKQIEDGYPVTDVTVTAMDEAFKG
jgi:hypothetical protein